MTADLFIPCFIDQLYPQTGWNVVKVLEKAGVEVNYNPRQTCCGQPTFNSGYWNASRKVAGKFIKDFPNDRPIVVPSASCAAYIRHHYPELFKDQPEMKQEVDRVSRNVVELTDFLVNHLKIENFDASFRHKVTYHDACSALREYGLKDEPRRLLSHVRGLELKELPENTTCCGFGGTFMVKFVPISTAMVEQKVENALSTGAEYIVSTEASCLLNIEGYIRKNELPLKTIHIADILAKF
ncbi:(Fe-S)-binding protein [Thermophagus sp. OGC60D27]|uniref:(Fe-S)-binding protein n=1 Tax=Thermophagus sp. OGC60D27 TaxID=3458415 RepID=UPI0040378C22